MAKKPKSSTINVAFLEAIGSGEITHISQPDGQPLVDHSPALIQVNTGDLDENGAAACRLTEAGKAYIAGGAAPVAASKYEIITGAVLPPSKRGNRGGGAPTQYPFDALEVGQTFFVSNDDKPNAVKKLGSTVSSANARYAEPTGETKTVMRTKRGPGNKAVKDLHTGENVKEQKSVPVKKATRKFTIRPVTAGQEYGSFTAPADGALIGRIL